MQSTGTDGSKEQAALPRIKTIEAIEQEYKTMKLRGSPYAMDHARKKLRKYQEEFHNSDSFWLNRALSRLKNNLPLDI